MKPSPEQTMVIGVGSYAKREIARLEKRILTLETKVEDLLTKKFKHGTSGYTYGCRCEICTEAMRVYRRLERAQKIGKT